MLRDSPLSKAPVAENSKSIYNPSGIRTASLRPDAEVGKTADTKLAWTMIPGFDPLMLNKPTFTYLKVLK